MQVINLQQLCTGRHLRPRHKPPAAVRWRTARDRPRSLCVVNVRMPAWLDEALSARRVNKLQIRSLCEMQQQEAEAALRLQQTQAEAALRLQQTQAEAALKEASAALILQQTQAEAALKSQKQDSELKHERIDRMLASRTSKYLYARDLLNVRGVLEWLEEEYGPRYSLQLNQKTEESDSVRPRKQ